MADWEHRQPAMDVVLGIFIALGALAFLVLLFTSGKPY